MRGRIRKKMCQNMVRWLSMCGYDMMKLCSRGESLIAVVAETLGFDWREHPVPVEPFSTSTSGYLYFTLSSLLSDFYLSIQVMIFSHILGSYLYSELNYQCFNNHLNYMP